MKRVSKILSILFICSLIFSSHVFAARTTMNLSAGMWTAPNTETRSGKYSYVEARLYAVYPPNGGWDTYQKIRVKVESSMRHVMSDEYILNETASTNTKIQLREGTLDNKSIRFWFRGNDPEKAAYADVLYDAK